MRPLCYREAGGGLEFAWERRAMPRAAVGLGALEAFLAFNSIPAPYSIFREVRKLPAGPPPAPPPGGRTPPPTPRPPPAAPRRPPAGGGGGRAPGAGAPGGGPRRGAPLPPLAA